VRVLGKCRYRWVNWCIQGRYYVRCSSNIRDL